MSNKGPTILFGKLCNSMPFREEYNKGSKALFYVEDLKLRGGFGINITEGWFEDFFNSVNVFEENHAVLDTIADLVMCFAFEV